MTSHADSTAQPPPPIFVFGSNLAGRHGRGAALWAREHRGAIYGRGIGPQGDAYAIPTKDQHLNVLSVDVIEGHVRRFLAYARERSDLRFELTPIGCGLAGYRPDQIAPMFTDAPGNVDLPASFAAAIAPDTGSP